MDIPSSTSTSCSWDLDMTMGNQLLLDQLPYEFLQPFDHHLPTQHLPSSSFSDQVENQRTVEDQLHEEAGGEEEEGEGEGERLGAMKEMMYKIAAMQPVDIDPATIKKPKRRNVRISDDPQSIAARHRRERISERIRILQRLVPGGTKMDTASMLDEAIRYVKFLKKQVQELQQNPPAAPHPGLVGRQLLALEWPLRTDGPGTSSSSMAPPHHHPHGLGFSSFSSDGSSSHMH